MTSERIKSADFNFDLPPDRIAQRPRPYAEQKLMQFDRQTRQISHHLFRDLPEILKPGDLLVANDSKVVPAALRSSDEVFILFTDLTQPSLENVRAICPSQPAVGDRIHFRDIDTTFVVKEKEPLWDVYVGDLITQESYSSLVSFLEQKGSHPIPNYILRSPDDQDEKDYQTVYATNPGSIACPVAGLHFYPELIEILKSKGIGFVTATLHVGYGTFRRFKKEYIDEHTADTEQYSVTSSTLHEIGRAHAEGRRIIAVGSTSARLIETIAHDVVNHESIIEDISGETSIFIYPGYKFQILSGLITNLPYPRIPVMSMAAAMTGLDELKAIIQSGLQNDYLFYSYGDAIIAL